MRHLLLCVGVEGVDVWGVCVWESVFVTVSVFVCVLVSLISDDDKDDNDHDKSFL